MEDAKSLESFSTSLQQYKKLNQKSIEKEDNLRCKIIQEGAAASRRIHGGV
jgi:hypothetical protein